MQKPTAVRLQGKLNFDAAALGGDIISGAIVALVSLAYSLSFALLIFSGALSAGLSFGVSAALLCAGICTIVVAFGSAFTRAIAGPDAAPMAIMASLAAGIAVAGAAPDATLPTVMAALAFASLATGVFLLVLGILRLETWMRYIPYPVLAGFISAVGLQLAFGGVFVVTGYKVTEYERFANPDVIAHLTAGLVFAAAIFVAQAKTKSHLALPVALVVAIVVCHLVLLALGVDLASAREAHWLMAPPSAGGVFWPWSHLGEVDWRALAIGGMEIAAGAAIIAINVLLNGTSLELWSRRGLNLNNELRINGLANLASSAAGGLPGNLSFNRTILNVRSGASGRRAGIIAGLFLLGLVAVGPGMIGMIPAPVLGGLLMYLGLNVLYETFSRARHTLGIGDYTLMAVLVALIVRWGYFEGVALGIVASCIMFVFRYSRLDVVRHDLTRMSFGSSIDRPRAESEFLRTNGQRMHIIWLRGYLFFGTANKLYTEIEKRVLAGGDKRLRHLVLDFSRVSGMDSSSVFSFVKLSHLAREHEATIAFADMSREAQAVFRVEGLLQNDDRYVRAFPTLDTALEWSEERMLDGKESAKEEAVDVWLTQELGSADLVARLMNVVTLVALEKDGVLFSQGDTSDSLYFIESGRLAVAMKTDEGETVRLRTMAKHTVLGEMGLYRSLVRTATVTALEPSRVMRLPIATFVELKTRDPDLCDAIHRVVARTLADRLAFANAAVAALQ